MTGETAGPVIGATGLVAFAAAVVAVKAGVLDAVVAAAAPVTGVGVLLGVVVVGLASKSSGGGSAGRATSGGRPAIRVEPHGPTRHHGSLTPKQRRTGSHLPAGERDRIRRHEKRHLRAARRLGANGWWEYTPDGGATFNQTNDAHLGPVEQAATAYAGNGGSWWAHSGCDEGDKACADWWINKLPQRDRARAHAEARRLARRIS